MPVIGGVHVPDELMPRVQAPAASRPALGAIFGAAAEGTFKQLTAALPYQFEVLTRDRVDPGVEQRYKAGLEDAAQAFSRAAPAQVTDLTSGRVGLGRFAVENLVASAPQMLGIAAGGVAGGVAGGPVGAAAGAVAAGTPLFSASNVARSVEEQGSLGQDAATRSLAFAPFQAAADTALLRYLPGAGKVLGDAAAAQAGGLIRRTATSMVKAGATEAVTEASQQIGERAAAGIPLGTPDALAEYVNAGVTALAVGGMLGAGGGFRRTNAVAKPVDMVTVEDMHEHIDGVANGTLRAAPAAQQGVLPLQGGRAVEQQLSLPDLAQPGQEVPASRLPQLPLDPALSGVAPEMQLELGQRFRDNLTPVQLPTEGGAQVSPELEELLRSVTSPRAAPLTAFTALSRGFEPAVSDVRVPEGAFRPFKDESLDDLQTAIRDKKSAPGLVEEAQRELARRDAEALGAAPLTAEKFQTRVDELKRGLRGGFVQKLEATTPEELVEKVYDEVFTNANTAANVQKFAQRVGVLDENLEPGPGAKKLEARRAAEASRGAGGTSTSTDAGGVGSRAAPPVVTTPENETGSQDPAVEAEMAAARKAAGIQRMSAASRGQPLNTPADVFRALATDNSDAQVSQVEKLARKLGLVTDDDAMDITPKGRSTFLQSPEGLQETVAAAQQQGYTGAAASQFDRGVRAELGGEAQTQFGGFEEMAAYEAGRVWARDFVDNGDTRTAAQTEAIRSRQADRGTAQPARGEPRRELLPGQVQQAALNRLIDAADLRAVNDTDVAALRRMVREGATSEEIGRALQQVQGGQTLFAQPERREYTSPPAQPLQRSQPLFKEMNTPVREAKATQRAETDATVQAYELRNLVQFALDEKGITAKRAEKLNQMLDEGKVAQVASAMKGFLAEANAPTSASVGGADPAFERAIDGKDFMEALGYMVENGPSMRYREIMQRVRELARGLQRVGVALGLRVVKPGDNIPAPLAPQRVRASTYVTTNPPAATVYLKSVELGDSAGMNFQLAAHEMVHAVTMPLVQRGNVKGVYGNTKLGRAVQDLYDLQHMIADHFNARVAQGNLNAFERAYFEKRNNSLADADEILAWGLTNPEMQRYLASIEYKPKQSVFERFVELLRNVLGLSSKHDTALTQLLRVSEQLMGVEAVELQSTFLRNDPAGFDESVAVAFADEASVSAQNRTVQAANEVTEGIARLADKVVGDVDLAGVAARSRRTVLGWLSSNQLVRQFGRAMPALAERNDAHRERVAVRSRYEQIGDEAYQAFEKLERENEKAAKMVGELMATSTEFQIDPEKTWDQHEHLHSDKNAAALERLHGEAVDIRNKLRRGNGEGWATYRQFRALNEAQNYSRMAAGLHSLVAMDPELSLGVENSMVNPVDQFMAQKGLDDAQAVRDWWERALHSQIAAAVNFVNDKKGEAAAGTESDQNAMRQHLSPIELQIGAIHEALAAMQKAPYFHLGRFGDNYVSFDVRRNADGSVDQDALRKVGQQLEAAGFNDARVSPDSTRTRVRLHLDSVSATRQLKSLAEQLAIEGVVERDSIEGGPRVREHNFGAGEGLPDYVARYVQSLETSPMFKPDDSMSDKERGALEKRKNDAIRLAIDTWLEQQPDSSISKVLTRRYTVPGYNKDMVRNFMHRWRVGSISLANVAAAPKFNRAYTNMRAQVEDAKRADSQSDAFLLNDLMREMKVRDALNPLDETANTFDKLRAFSHAYFLGMSPAYGLINMTQMGVVALPELAKKHGYAKSFHALRRAGSTAFKVLRAVAAEAQQLSPARWADVAITESVLKKANLSPVEHDFILRMLATGTVDIGSAARALGQVAENRVGSRTDVALKYASAVGMYTETFSRLTTALAARELHGGSGESAAGYAAGVVSNSMFDYQNWNTARQLGKRGFLGPVTPIVTQFMSYSVQITEKLYSEVMDAAGKQRPGETAEQATQRRREARTFLLGHLTAVTALAGTLGMPFATVFSAVIERLVDAVDDDEEPFDATAAWRGFLADVFGKDVAEVVARGLPRALGFDISARAGEQNLLPFSEFIADRRPWKEAAESYTGRSLGAVPSMFSNIVSGGGKIADGDLLGGMKDVLPVAFKGPVEAYRMTGDGYVDSRGNKLPLSPGASAILWQLLGFGPAEKAEYSEARGDQAARRGEITRQAAALRQRIIKAMLEGDGARASELISEAQQFDVDNPAFAVVPSLASSLQRQLEARTRAQALRTPLGVPVNDIAGQDLTRYANVSYTAR